MCHGIEDFLWPSGRVRTWDGVCWATFGNFVDVVCELFVVETFDLLVEEGVQREER